MFNEKTKQREKETYSRLEFIIYWNACKKVEIVELGVQGNHGTHQGKMRWSYNINDSHDQFETIVLKWKKIHVAMMIVGLSKHMRNGLTCKSKWGTISRKFKIFEYTLGTSPNGDY